MKPSELFRPQDLLTDFSPTDKWAAISELVDHLVASGRLPAEQSERVLDAVLSRERSMSTGMELGVAIPHAAVDELSEVQACMGIVGADGGLEFESVDGQPAHFIVLLVIPRGQKLLHIRTLADVARVLGKGPVREGLRAASSGDEARAVLVASEA